MAVSIPAALTQRGRIAGLRLAERWYIDKRLAGLTRFAIATTLLNVIGHLWLGIRLDTRRPVLSRQQRYGFNREIIEVFKFRTMCFDRCAPVVQATKQDPSVTRVGMCLCRINELPQPFDPLTQRHPHESEHSSPTRLPGRRRISVCAPACKRLPLVRCRGAG
jgi:Bacterial sugar transferase